jgi:hypothetical protein
MNVGDMVVSVTAVGTIVGVAKSGNPVVEWVGTTYTNFEEMAPEDLIVVELPKPTEELDPSKDTE